MIQLLFFDDLTVNCTFRGVLVLDLALALRSFGSNDTDPGFSMDLTGDDVDAVLSFASCCGSTEDVEVVVFVLVLLLVSIFDDGNASNSIAFGSTLLSLLLELLVGADFVGVMLAIAAAADVANLLANDIIIVQRGSPMVES